MRPIHHRIIVENVKMYEPYSESEIVRIDDYMPERSCVGTIVAIGKDVTRVALGQRVLFQEFSGEDLDDGTRLLHELNALAVVEE